MSITQFQLLSLFSPVSTPKIFLMTDPAIYVCLLVGFPGGSEVKVSACNVGDLGSIPGSGRSPGEGNGNPLQDSCLGNSMDRGAWRATIESDITL